MLFHSIIPIEIVFGKADWESFDKPYMTTVYKGVTMEVSDAGEGKKQIERIYSTNPKDYMNPCFRIGTQIVLPDKQ